MPSIALMVILPVVFVSTGNFLFFRLLPFLGEFVDQWGFRMRWLRIGWFTFLFHVVLQKNGCGRCAWRHRSHTNRVSKSLIVFRQRF